MWAAALWFGLPASYKGVSELSYQLCPDVGRKRRGNAEA